MAVKATPISWTLLFKSGTTTILLYSNPDTSFSSLKAALLTALAARGPDLAGSPLPASADDIYLARPVDPEDRSVGWEALDGPLSGGEEEDDEEDDDGVEEEEEEKEDAVNGRLDGAGAGLGKGKKGRARGKGKGKKRAVGVGKRDCPSDHELRDGSVVAFKFGREAGWVVEVPRFEEEDEDDDEAGEQEDEGVDAGD